MSKLGLRLTPHGRLSVEERDDAPDIDAAASIRLIDAFARGTGYGLVWLGAATNDNAAWAQANVSLNAFAGQSVRILIEAADASTASLVEAAVDDVKVTQQ